MFNAYLIFNSKNAIIFLKYFLRLRLESVAFLSAQTFNSVFLVDVDHVFYSLFEISAQMIFFNSCIFLCFNLLGLSGPGEMIENILIEFSSR